MLNLSDVVTVYNKMYCQVNASSTNAEYKFEPMDVESQTPYAIDMPFSEVKSINARGALFREGFLCFSDEQAKEVYESLYIRDYKNILSNEDIKDAILHPKKEKLDKILAIKSQSYFERVYGIFYALKQSKSYDISFRVCDLIKERQKELNTGKINTKLSVVLMDEDQSEDVETLKARLASLEKQLADKSPAKTRKPKQETVVEETKVEE